MSCFPCFSSGKSRKTNSKRAAVSGELNAPPQPENSKQKASAETKNKKDEANNIENGNIAAQTFTFRELATATKNFRLECLLGEGGFGRVYKGTLEKSGQVVAVKQLDRTGLQGNKEFLVEVLMLSLLHHQNLVNLIGYCADGDQRLLVYEYLSGGSVEDHLLDIGSDQKPLDWFTRMKIASGAAKGLEYLHDKANPPVIYRDLKASNILLDEDFNPKLSDFGLAKLGTVGDKMNVSSRVMGTYGYCAPEYARAGELTMKSDVYSFGVVLLELITGRRVIDTTRPNEEQNLVSWAQPIFRNPKRFPDMADPLLNGQFPERGLNQAVAIAAMCLQEEASVRPLISDVVSALSFLSVVSKEDIPAPLPVPTPPLEEKNSNEGEGNHNHQKSDDEGHHSHSENEDEDDQDHEDGGSSDHEDGDSAKHQDGDNSDYEDEDLAKHQYENSSHRQEGESAYQEDKESEDEHQQTVKEAKVWALNSSHKSSKGSRDGINYFSHTSSIGSDDESVFSSSPKSKRGSQDGIVSLSRNSSRESEDESASLSRYSSGKSDYGNVFSSRNSSSRSQDGGVSLSHNSSRGSQDGSGSVFSSTHNSSRGSQHGSVSLIKRPEKQ